MSNFSDVVLFDNKSLADIFKQIHKNNKDTDKQISDLIDTIKPIASQNAGNAVMLMPTVKDLIDVNVKNNEQLIKMAAIAQRAATANSTSQGELINYDEIQDLLKQQEEIKEQSQKLLEQPLKVENK
jgi:hypothetical protein